VGFGRGIDLVEGRKGFGPLQMCLVEEFWLKNVESDQARNEYDKEYLIPV
jgi:hypothetical protein